MDEYRWSSVHVFWVATLFTVCVLIVGILLGAHFGEMAIYKEAIEHGCVRHHPKTGEYEWLHDERTE